MQPAVGLSTWLHNPCQDAVDCKDVLPAAGMCSYREAGLRNSRPANCKFDTPEAFSGRRISYMKLRTRGMPASGQYHSTKNPPAKARSHLRVPNREPCTATFGCLPASLQLQQARDLCDSLHNLIYPKPDFCAGTSIGRTAHPGHLGRRDDLRRSNARRLTRVHPV
jgi:hypothetical protein